MYAAKASTSCMLGLVHKNKDIVRTELLLGYKHELNNIR